MRRQVLSALTLLVVLCGCAHVRPPDRAMVTLGSLHVAEKSDGWDYNAVNPGMLVTWGSEPADWTAGAFLNSYGLPSVAGFASLPLIERDAFALEAFGGLALYPVFGRHFPIHLGDVVPLAGLAVRMEPLSLLVLPSDCVYACAIIVGGLNFAL